MKCSPKCCPDAYEYNPGFSGANPKFMFVLNRSDSRALGVDYQSALLQSQTGRTLTEILVLAEITWEDIFLTNAFKCLLPGDREPTRAEYEACEHVLRQQVIETKPDKIVCFGLRPYQTMFNTQQGIKAVAGSVTDYLGIPTMVTYHPSRKDAFSENTDYYTLIADFLSKEL